MFSFLCFVFAGCSLLDFDDNKPTKGLEYILNEDETSYIVSKGTIKDSVQHVIIPNIYNELPVTIIADNAFSRLTNIESIVIPDGIEKIGIEAFLGCSNLLTITIPDSVINIGKSAFFGCLRIETMTIPFIGESEISYNYFGFIFGANTPFDHPAFVPNSLKTIIVTEGIKNIYAYAFHDCSSLTTLVLPESITGIEQLALSKCINIESITIPFLYNYLYLYPFITLFGLDSIPEKLHTINTSNNTEAFAIQSSAFEGLTGLKNITIPDSIEVIGPSAFKGCSSLEKIVIPKSVVILEGSAFSDCPNLTIYCEILAPSVQWNPNWNIDNLPVVYGYVETN